MIAVPTENPSAAAAAAATGLEAAFSANAAASSSVASQLSRQAFGSSLNQELAAGQDGSSNSSGPRGIAGWLAGKLGVADEATAAAASSSGVGSSSSGWRLTLVAERTPQQLVQVCVVISLSVTCILVVQLPFSV